MNISQAKRHVKATVSAYLAKDSDGMYKIEPEKQRPLFLVGAPGIGKTAIMSQIADELGIGLVSYSMTHHTRQSALGLPFIVHHDFEGFEYEASEYTMSEIVASLYDYMQVTNTRSGILFLDEINCVSETLYPSMLQFLQFKTFGRHKIPDDWVVVCAGNPPEYNKSVHEFDVVIMDRLRKIAIEPEYDAWKRYAVDHQVHPAILTFLESKRDCFYRVMSTPEGKIFVTARGWDDLSRIITYFEEIDEPVDLELIEQFLQDSEIAEKFALYYELFRKYQSDYQVGAILEGNESPEIVERAQAAAFDERLALLSLLLDGLTSDTTAISEQEQVMMSIRDALRAAKPAFLEGGVAQEILNPLIDEQEANLARLKVGNATRQEKIRVTHKTIDLLKKLLNSCVLARTLAGEAAWNTIHQQFRGLVGDFEVGAKSSKQQFENAFEFVERAYGDDREILVFMTELAARQALSSFVSKFGCEGYFRHSDELRIKDHRSELFARIDDLASIQSAGSDDSAAPQNQPEKAQLAAQAAAAADLKAYYENANFEYGYASLCHMGLPPHLEGKTVLDIGCRRGRGIFKLSDRVGAQGRAIGLDWNPAYIDECTAKMDRAWKDTGLPANNMEFYLAYPEDLISCGIGTETIDVVFINSVLHLTCTPKKVLEEIYRVLKPGGLLVAEIAFADGHRDAQVVKAAREMGNSIQAAPCRDEFVAYMQYLGFGEPQLQEGGPISPATGYRFDFEVATAPSDESVQFEATVTHFIKQS